jgi:hypothetical protein
MSDNIDALVYAGINNNITSSTTLNSMNPVPPNLSTVDQYNTAFNSYLTSTSIKRACCLASQKGIIPSSANVNVRIPIPSNWPISEDTNSLHAKFGYIDKNITIPVSMCPTETIGPNASQYCDVFYNVYCNNALTMYNDEITTPFDPIEWSQYKPECSCYAPINQQYASHGIPPACYQPGCLPGNSPLYLDPVSRSAIPCNSTICQSMIQLNNVSAGQGININNSGSQQCGANSVTQTTTTSSGSTGPINSTTSSNPTTTQPPLPSQPSQPSQPTLPNQSNQPSNVNGESPSSSSNGQPNRQSNGSTSDPSSGTTTQPTTTAESESDSLTKMTETVAKSMPPSVGIYFTKSKFYLGYILIGVCLLLVIIFLIYIFSKRKKNRGRR